MKIAFRVVSAMLIFAVAAMGCMSTSRPKPTALGVGCPPAKVDLKWAATVTRAEVSQEGLNYRIYVPENIGFFEKVPLVVFLHGAGERGNDNTVQMIHAVPQLISYSMRKNEKAIIIAPQCPEKLRWFETPWDKTEHHTTSEPSVSMDKVIKLLDRMLAEYPIDADRVYVTGLSMGGYGTWDLSARRPELFAAALPVCGGGDVTQAHKLAKLSLMTVHGDKDGAVPVQNSRQMVKAVRDAGGNITYIELAGQGHGVWGYTYSSDKNLEWLFAQRRGVTP